MTRSDSPSETSEPSRTTGSDAPAKTRVPPSAPADAPVVVPSPLASSSSPPQPAAMASIATTSSISNLCHVILKMTPFAPAPPGSAGVSPSDAAGRKSVWALNRQGRPKPPFDLLLCGRLGGEAGEIAQRREPRERLALELADALPRQVELVADRLQRPGLALEAETQLEDAPLALRKRVERPPDALLAQRLLRLDERVGGFAVGEEIAELALVVRAHRLVERDRRVRGAERLVDVLDRKAGGLGELLLRRLAAEFDLEAPGGTRELLLPLDDVDRDSDRPRVVGDGALHRLADPPGRVRGELEAAAPVELLDGAIEAERSLLDQVEERHAEAAVALRDGDDEPEVRLDHRPLRDGVAPLDQLRQLHLLGGVQQLVPADVGEEELEAVSGARGDGDGSR